MFKNNDLKGYKMFLLILIFFFLQVLDDGLKFTHSLCADSGLSHTGKFSAVLMGQSFS